MAAPTPVLLWRLLTTVRNWPVYFRNRFGMMEGSPEVRFRFWNGMTMTGRPKSLDRCIINEEWLDRCYEPNQAGIPFDWSACRTIIDIGAHIGGFTLYAAAHAPNARIIAFEPEPSNARVLRQNIADNHLDARIVAEQKAVAGTRGMLTLHRTFASTSSGGHSLIDYAHEGDDIPVDAITLADMFREHDIQHCDFLKIDCEGAEYDILYGLSDELYRTINFIALEYHHFSPNPKHTGPPLRAHLETKGFTVMTPSKSLYFAYRA
jgi:FkbM family methyltransferase